MSNIIKENRIVVMENYMTKTLLPLFALFILLFFQARIVKAAGSVPTQPTFQYLRDVDCSIVNYDWKESQTGSSAVTRIEIYRERNDWDGKIYGFKVNYNGEIVPGGWGCDHVELGATLILNHSDYITQIQTWYKLNEICQVEFRISNSTVRTYTTSRHNINNCSVSGTATFTASNQFVGFWGRGNNNNGDCEAQCLVAQSFTRSCSTDTISAIDVSSFNSGSLTLVLGATQTKTLSATTGFGLTTCTINYQITMTPAAPCNSLITLSGNTLTFAASDNLANSAVCRIDVQASIGERGTTLWSAATTGTFTYVNPCVSAQMTGSCWQYLTVNLFSTASVEVNAWSDTVTDAKNNGTQICPYTTLDQYVSTATTIQNSTIAAKFTYTNTASTYTIAVAPTLQSEITGTLPSYVITSQMCLSDALLACKTCTTHITVNCGISWIKIQQQTPSGSLSAQTWTISSSTQFTYQLAVDLTTSCGYTPTSWLVVTTSSNNAAAVGNFQTISSAGLFTAGTFTDNTNAGIYNVSVTSVTLNGVVYSNTTNPGIQTTASSNSFELTVVAAADPCLTATVTASSVAAISVFAFETSAVYSPFSAFTYTLSSMPTTNCGDFTYSVSLARGTALNDLTTFALSTGTTGFQVYSGDKNQVGTFTATLTGTLTSYPSRSAQLTFTITVVDPCLNTYLTSSPPSLNDMSCSVSQVAACTQQSPIFDDGVSSQYGTSTLCGGLTYSISDSTSDGSTALTASELIVDSNGLITVQTTNAATIGTHTATLLVKLTFYQNITLTLNMQIQITACVVTSAQVYQSFNSGTPAALTAQSYGISQTNGFSLQLSIVQTPACGYTVFGWSVSVTTTSGTPPNCCTSFDSTTGVYSIAAGLPQNQAGQYTVAISIVSINNVAWAGLLITPSSFQMTVISPCATTTVQPIALPSVSLKVWEGSVTSAYNFFPTATLYFNDSASTEANTPGFCAISYTATISTSGTGQSITRFDYSASQLNIYSDNMLQIGTYTVTVTGTVVNYPTQFQTSQFQISITDPCLSPTTINSATFQPMTTSVLVASGAITQPAPTFNDTVSAAHGNGVDVCGARQFAITSTPTAPATALTSSELSIGSSSGLISLITSNSAHVGTHTATVTVTLASYSSVTAITAVTTTFTITIQPCIITSFTTTTPATQTYTIANYSQSSPFTWNLVVSSLTTQVPACGYSQTASADLTTVTNLVTTIPGSTISFQAYSRNRTLANTYSIGITQTLTGYTYSPVPSCNTIQSFIAVDPCLATTVINGPTLVYDFVEFAGQSQSSNISYSFNDSVSQNLTSTTDTADYCGGKTLNFLLNGTATKLLSGNNTQTITFAPPLNSTSFGTQNATLNVCLNDYPSVCLFSPLNFKITILGIQPPSITNQTYEIGSTKLNISFDPFVIIPQNYSFSPPINRTLAAYFIANQQQQINSTTVGLTQILNQNWITLYQNTSSFTVETQNTSLVGNYTILLVKSIDKFPNYKAETQFQLSITSAPVQITKKLKPPYFEPVLSNQVVKQCADYRGNLWKFKLPETVDPQNTYVSISVDLDKTFFSFDPNSKTITQLAVPENPVNKSISITLSDEYNVTAKYSMIVQFQCILPPNLTFVVSKTTSDAKKQKQWPTAYVSLVEPNGLMHIKFNQKMKIPERPSDVQDGTVFINGTKYPILEITVIPGRLSEPQKVKLSNWTFVNYTSSELLIQLTFENAMYVSSHSSDPEKVKVQIFGIELFADIYAKFMYPETILNEKVIPQMASQGQIAQAQALAAKAQNVVTTAMLSNMVVSILISGPLQQLLGSIRQLQIITHIMLIKVAYPATSTIYFGILNQILTFQFYDFTQFYSRSLSLDSIGQNSWTDNFNSIGYGSMYIIQNFGTLCWIIFVTPLMWAVTPIVVAISRGELKHLKQTVTRMMFYNNWIQFFYETYLFLGVCAALNFYYLKFDTYGNAINSLVALFFGLILVIFPFFVIVHYNLPKNKVKIKTNNEEFFQRFGSVLEGLNFLRRGQWVTIYPFFNCLRKLSLIYVVVSMQDMQVFSIFIVNFQTIFMIMIVGYVSPFKEQYLNNMELINEAFVLLTNYHLFTFTEFMPNIQVRQHMGNSLVVTTVFNLLTNIGVVTIVTLALSARKIKLAYLRWKRDQLVRKNKEDKLYEARWAHIYKNIFARERQKAKEAKAQAKAIKREEKKKRLAKKQQLLQEAQLQREVNQMEAELRKQKRIQQRQESQKSFQNDVQRVQEKQLLFDTREQIKPKVQFQNPQTYYSPEFLRFGPPQFQQMGQNRNKSKGFENQLNFISNEQNTQQIRQQQQQNRQNLVNAKPQKAAIKSIISKNNNLTRDLPKNVKEQPFPNNYDQTLDPRSYFKSMNNVVVQSQDQNMSMNSSNKSLLTANQSMQIEMDSNVPQLLDVGKYKIDVKALPLPQSVFQRLQKILHYKPMKSGTTRYDPKELQQMSYYKGKEVDEQIAAVFPNLDIDFRIAEAFRPADPITDFRLENGIDQFIFQEIQQGKLDKVLQEYAQQRRMAQNQFMSFRDPSGINDFEDFGEYSPAMSLKEQGELYEKVIHHRDTLHVRRKMIEQARQKK